jgi:hypothetical protein
MIPKTSRNNNNDGSPPTPPTPATTGAAPPATPGGCPHFLADFYHVRIGDGHFEVHERCAACGRNMRGRGAPVPAAELLKRRIQPLPVRLPVSGQKGMP